ncbi:MAG TPA: hypothetical protein VK634_11140 [Reyranella sp.]|nr:hypothetical protein [Reyranella sp.]HTE81231.1 hypothetical protein [Reyranella sp.]
MEKILFLSPRLSDLATLTASSEVGSLPATFVKNPEPTKVWRTTGCAAESLVIDFGAAAVVDTAAIVAHNATAAGTVRLRLAATVPGLTAAPSVDSGVVSLWPSSGKHADPDWPHELSLARAVNGMAYRYARLDFADPANPAGYLEFGRIAAGRAWQPAMNIDLDPALGFVPLDVQEPNAYGQTFTDPRPWAQRQFDLSFSAANQDDVHDYAMELSRLRGQAGDVIVCLDPSATTRFHRWSMQALFTGRAVFKAQPLWDGADQTWGFSASLIEKL